MMLPGFPSMVLRRASAVAEAFPVVEATNQGGTSGTTQATTFDVPLPSGIQAGDDLMIIIGLVATNTSTITTPSGWTLVATNGGTGSNMRRLSVFHRKADGSEGADVSVTTSVNSGWATNSYRISGAQGTPEATTATGSSSSPNPPSLSPSWGSAKTLWIATEADLATNSTLPTLPSNYTDRVVHTIIFFGDASGRLSSGRRELEAASEDPGTFGLGSSGNWITATIAIQPA